MHKKSFGLLILGATIAVRSVCANGAEFMPFTASDAETGAPAQFISATGLAGGRQGGEAARCGADPCQGVAGGCADDDCGPWWRFRRLLSSTEVSFGGEAYKSTGDATYPLAAVGSGFMNSAGLVGGFNTGLGPEESKIRAQFGTTVGLYDLYGRDVGNVRREGEQQVFVTGGFYKRSDVCGDDRISWGIVYDHLFATNYGLAGSDFNLGQVRGIIGYALNETNEVGFWGVGHTGIARIGGTPAFARVRASDQANLYWRHQYGFGGSTMVYAGGASSNDQAGWIFGLNGQAPLNNKFSLYGNFTFAPPKFGPGSFGADSLEWGVGFGLTYSFGGKAASATVSGQRDMPLLPVANNSTMLITR